MRPQSLHDLRIKCAPEPGCMAQYDALCVAHDALVSAPTEAAKDRAFIAMVNAAVACDPHCLRAPSISAWVERRVSTYRESFGFRPDADLLDAFSRARGVRVGEGRGA